jgi:hypothetical protein
MAIVLGVPGYLLITFGDVYKTKEEQKWSY